MKVCAGLVAGCCRVAALAVGFAQAPPALKSVIGEVTSIDAASKQIKLKGDDGAAYTVTLERQHVVPAHPSRRERSQEGQPKSHSPT